MSIFSRRFLVSSMIVLLWLAQPALADPCPIQIGFLWHMHQPIYYPYETVIETEANGWFGFSVVDVHNQRWGPYTTWPNDAIQSGLGLSHLGAQISFSGSLIENLNNLEAAGVNGGMWNNWDSAYDQGVSLDTSLGNPRLDMVAFGYHHPVMPLLDERDIRMQIRLHKHVYGQTWNGGPTYSSGMFPPETAFSTRIIPALVAEGVDWVLIDNIHFDRACKGFPHTNDSNLFAPNAADQVNPNPADNGGLWLALNNLWAPGQVSVPFGYRPHYIQHVDPETGSITQMVGVPAARYEGQEDGRGGFGALQYELVMSQYLPYNTDPAHPMFVVLHHDGDNYGGGSDAYYHHNFQNMVSWAGSEPDYDVSTVEDYLDRFPPDAGDVIHVEDGAWSGADNGDPEFKKWLGDPDGSGWSPDRNSWAVLTAAKNRVFMADDVSPVTSMQNVLAGTGSSTERAWHYLLCSETSCYWYWDGTEVWDDNVTRGCNQAVAFADAVIAGQPDSTPPTVFLPQRNPYNPGGYEWGASVEPSDFEVWTYAYDVSGLTSVTLKWRVDADGENPLASIENETYAGGAGVGAWNTEAMLASDVSPPASILTPTYRAMRWSAMITGQENVLIDYYIEAVDGQSNIQKTPIMHVYVGEGGGSGPGDDVQIEPNPAQAGQNVTVSYDPAGGPLASASEVFLHYGFNDWATPMPDDEAMTLDVGESVWEVTVYVPSNATQLDMVFTDHAGIWDNNNGNDWHFTVEGGTSPVIPWEMDGSLDAVATEVATNNGMTLWAGVKGNLLYVATDDAGEGNDHFIFLAATPGALRGAPWAKSGQVADWNAFLADENDNDYSNWFDTSSSNQAATGANGGVLEGTINLVDEYGSIPDTVYLAVGPYQTPDGGALNPAAQVPASQNDDANVDANEYAAFSTLMMGDCNGDWQVDVDDISCFVGVLLGEDTDARHVAAVDFNANGYPDGGDVQGFTVELVH